MDFSNGHGYSANLNVYGDSTFYTCVNSKFSYAVSYLPYSLAKLLCFLSQDRGCMFSHPSNKFLFDKCA